MLCENCGKKEANVKYTQIINGNKKELILCERCSKELGVDDISFNMPISFSSFFSDFFDEFEDSVFLPDINNIKQLKCNNCNTTFEEFMNHGKFGCSNCYSIFEEKINPLLKNIHGSDTHIGRIGKIEKEQFEGIRNNMNKKLDTDGESKNKAQNEVKIQNIINKKENKIESLKQELNKAIKEERYEDAAKIRDEIKRLE